MIKIILHHLKGFFPIWLCFFLLCIATCLISLGAKWSAITIGGASLLIFILLLIFKPMNVVYGLMGTTGRIGIFFGNFLLISIIFSFIYYWGFFKNAGISYDINQPHIEYEIFRNTNEDRITVIRNERIPIYNLGEQEGTYLIKPEEIHYQRIGFGTVLRNSVTTSLIQEPMELFSSGSTLNLVQDRINRSEEVVLPRGVSLSDENTLKTQMFHIMLIVQILISWIFFGVFISLLYSKFRNES